MNYRRAAILALVLLLPQASAANGAYTLTPLCNGSSSVSAAPGDTFTVDMVLTSPPSPTITSAVFNVAFTAEGLEYHTYTWGGVFSSTTQDKSVPRLSELISPLPITATTYGDEGSPIDVHLEAYISQDFATGTIASLVLSVPAGYAEQTITISAVPDTFAGNGGHVPTVAGPALTLHVVSVPEPSALLLLAAAGSLLGGWKLWRSMGRRPGGPKSL